MRKVIAALALILLCFGLQSKAQIRRNKTKVDTLSQYLSKKFAGIDTISVPDAEQALVYNQSLLYKLRLDSIQKIVPLTYNEYVQNYIDIYSRRKDQFGRLLGLSTYYFPIFEKALKAYNIPAEIKYLPIIESSMNPQAVSRVGATGMWQFMFGTAKAYGLSMDNFVDERKDPIAASYAAAAYFRDAYQELGDWLLAIAAYNCGKGNVTRAIDKAGSRDFWEIRNFLPKETRNYVPAFIAAVYTMNYAKVHNIIKSEVDLAIKTDTLQVNHFVNLNDMASATNWDADLIFALNPSYKKRIVNGTEENPKRVIMPKIELANYAALYDVINADVETSTAIVLASTDDVRELKKLAPASRPYSYYRVQPGQNLGVLAKKFGVEVQDIKVWNSLPSATIVPGQKLKIYGKGVKPSLTKPQADFLSYTVKKGDTLSSIAEKFDGATVADIKKLNGLSRATIQPGTVLKISKG